MGARLANAEKERGGRNDRDACRHAVEPQSHYGFSETGGLRRLLPVPDFSSITMSSWGRPAAGSPFQGADESRPDQPWY